MNASVQLSMEKASNHMATCEWRGQGVCAKVVPRDNSLFLEITLVDKAQPTGVRTDNRELRKLQTAAKFALDLDATLARSVLRGQIARFEVRRPRTAPTPRPRNGDETTVQRPLIGKLISPLLTPSKQRESLRPFQELGVCWLVQQRAGILADDMGLGKTVQALRALEWLIEQGDIRSAVIVCPKSLLANWEAECSRWVSGLTVVTVVPSKGHAVEVWSAILGRAHIIITSYEKLRLLPAPLVATRLELMIADEAHRLRRSEAKLVRAFRQIHVARFWALTGTPIERHEEDLATLLSLLEPTRFSVKNAMDDPVGLRSEARPISPPSIEERRTTGVAFCGRYEGDSGPYAETTSSLCHAVLARKGRGREYPQAVDTDARHM